MNLKLLTGVIVSTAFLLPGSASGQTADFNIVPQPLQADVTNDAPFILNGKTSIVVATSNNDMKRNATLLASYIEQTTGVRPTVGKQGKDATAIVLSIDKTISNAEGYKLDVDAKRISIAGASAAGVFYGIQTLRKSLPVVSGKASQVTVPCAHIVDAPRFSYRGTHLDVSRHFVSTDEIRQFIDILALHNINRFHWHLTDDQGWRIEIKKYPLLTEVGSKRTQTVIGHNTGKYDGIGALIRQKDDYVRIAQPYQGSPADKAGLKIGDKILSIDGKDAKGFTTEQVSSRLKGEPGSKVKVTVEHLDGTQQTAAIRRERIAIPGVPYAGWVADGIGYIRHSDFTEGCYEEMRAAIERLRTEKPLKGLVLDYRSNGGGIMQEAVKILGMFVPKGTEVVSTKGRSEDSKQVFRTDTEPILADLPLTVLINGNSASSAEIVAGALQDLDRAVLIGQRSFGKGLVQSPRPLGYNAMLKLTTAKYYIPSGRCIQAIDYSHSQEGS
ncbi:S41 family peptidase, partial [Leyella stercorea]|uniref:S41 family peptidase n=1 Tax=Leyella stercorea TaxID=363265 RepID=UPI00242BED0C